jgi:hypothetical protein
LKTISLFSIKIPWFTLFLEAIPGLFSGLRTLEIEKTTGAFPGQKVSTLELSAGEKFSPDFLFPLNLKALPPLVPRPSLC